MAPFTAVVLLLMPPERAEVDPGEWSDLNLTLGDLHSSETGLGPPLSPL